MQLILDSRQLPATWKVKTLDELCEIARGGSPRPIKQFITSDSNGVNWIKISDASASSKYIYETKEKIKPEGIKHSRLVSEGDFILSNSMSFGRPYIMRTSGCIHDGWLVLKDKSNLFDQDYLYYFLGSSTTYKQFDSLAAGSTVRNLNIDLVKGVKVILPPLSEQKRIVSIVDEAFEGIDRAIANTEKNLANAHELFESYLNAVFTQKGEGWEKKKLGDIASFRNGINFTKDSKGELIRIVGVKDFKDRFWIQEDRLEYVTIDGELKEIDTLRKGDVLTVRSNGNKELIGRCVLADELSEKTSHSGFTIRIRIERDNIYSAFIVHFLKSRELRKQLIDSGGGISISSLNQQGLSLIMISFPSLPEQKTIVANIDELAIETQRLEAIYKQKLAALKELKQSILHKAFTGELTADTATQNMKATKEAIEV